MREEIKTSVCSGINLLKIHGALDVLRTVMARTKLVPDERTVRGIIEMLRIAQEELVYIDPQRSDPVKSERDGKFGECKIFLFQTLMELRSKFSKSENSLRTKPQQPQEGKQKEAGASGNPIEISQWTT